MNLQELLLAAEEYTNSFKYDDAINCYETALAREDLTPDDLHTLLDLLSTCYHKRGWSEKCIELLECFPQPEYLSDSFAASVLKAYYNLGRYEEADEFYKRAEKILYGEE